MLAARRCAIEAIRRRFDLLDADVVGGLALEFDGVSAVRGDESRCDTKLLTWLRGQTAVSFGIKMEFSRQFFIQIFTSNYPPHLDLEIQWCHCTSAVLPDSKSVEMQLHRQVRRRPLDSADDRHCCCSNYRWESVSFRWDQLYLNELAWKNLQWKFSLFSWLLQDDMLKCSDWLQILSRGRSDAQDELGYSARTRKDSFSAWVRSLHVRGVAKHCTRVDGAHEEKFICHQTRCSFHKNLLKIIESFSLPGGVTRACRNQLNLLFLPQSRNQLEQINFCNSEGDSGWKFHGN